MFGNFSDKIRLLFHKDKESYLRFYRMLGFYPKDIRIYQQALLHKSLLVKSEEGRPMNNERLEFLGDAVLDAVVAEILYRKFAGKREGFLTNTRSKIVQRETLNRLAMEIGLDKLIKYTARQSSHNSYLCGNAFEALIGAIYLDRGYEACKYFMEHRIIGPFIDLEKISKKEVNFKSKLIEWSQKNRIEAAFQLVSQSKDQALNPTFESEVLIEGISAGRGTGYSKKESQQHAAQEAMGRIKKEKGFLERVIQAKEARENPPVDETKPTPEPAIVLADVREEVEHTETSNLERIIREAEEAAFKN